MTCPKLGICLVDTDLVQVNFPTRSPEYECQAADHDASAKTKHRCRRFVITWENTVPHQQLPGCQAQRAHHSSWETIAHDNKQTMARREARDRSPQEQHEQASFATSPVGLTPGWR